MVEVRLTRRFSEWLNNLKDSRAHDRIVAPLRRVQLGNLGDVKPVGGGVSEMRIDHGPGFRLYFVQRGDTLVILLCGGTKKSQSGDIEAARGMAKDY